MKEPFTLSIESETAKEFRKACIDRGQEYSDAVETFMKEFAIDNKKEVQE